MTVPTMAPWPCGFGGMMRERIGFNDTTKDILIRMSEGNPGGLTVMMELLKDGDNLIRLFDLDDMNIWGTQIWIGYKDYCESDIKKFIECVKYRD